MKYGMSMADNPADAGEWLVNLQEELMDAVLYMERLKEELKAAADMVKEMNR